MKRAVAMTCGGGVLAANAAPSDAAAEEPRRWTFRRGGDGVAADWRFGRFGCCFFAAFKQWMKHEKLST
eukprot:s545_g7.t1